MRSGSVRARKAGANSPFLLTGPAVIRRFARAHTRFPGIVTSRPQLSCARGCGPSSRRGRHRGVRLGRRRRLAAGAGHDPGCRARRLCRGSGRPGACRRTSFAASSSRSGIPRSLLFRHGLSGGEVRPALAGQPLGLRAAPVGDPGVVAGDQHLRDGPAFEFLRPRIVRMFEQARPRNSRGRRTLRCPSRPAAAARPRRAGPGPPVRRRTGCSRRSRLPRGVAHRSRAGRRLRSGRRR